MADFLHGFHEVTYQTARTRLPLLPGEKTVCVTAEPAGKKSGTGENSERVKNGASSLAISAYGKRKPLRALVRRARRSIRDAMSPRDSRSWHTRRRLLPIALCGMDRLLLLMVSTILPSLMRYLGMDSREDIQL
jgi:hypothetical protein